MIGFANTLGVAAGSARLRNLNPEQTRAALDIAGALAGWCPAEAIFGPGSSMKPLLFGAWPASSGLLAARYAAVGMNGPPAILEGARGFSTTVARQLDVAALEASTWALSRPRRKAHACCGYIHSALDTLARRFAEEPAALEDARAIRVRVAPYVMQVMGRSTLPQTSNEARFHAQYCVALAASGCETILPTHSEEFEKYLAAADLQRMYARITLEADESLTHYHQTNIEIEGADGAVRRHANTSPKGAPDNPMTDQEVIAKFHSLADPVVGEERADQIQTFVDGLSHAKSLQALWAALAGGHTP
jgi:2-methylcitrate dehydratase PrpD